MSSCGSSGEDFLGWRLRQVQKDLNQGKHVDWATEEEIAARQAEMERSVREEVKKSSDLRTSWDGVYVKSRRILIKGSTLIGLPKKRLQQDKRRWSAP